VRAQIESRDFQTRPSEEIAAFLAAYAVLGADATLEMLNKLWRRRLLGTKPLPLRLGANTSVGSSRFTLGPRGPGASGQEWRKLRYGARQPGSCRVARSHEGRDRVSLEPSAGSVVKERQSLVMSLASALRTAPTTPRATR